MDNSSGIYIEKMAELLGKKKQLLQEMLTLTKAQTPVIAADSLDKLQKLVEDKQGLIDRINELDDEFTAYMDKLKSAVGISKLDDIDISRFPAAVRLKQGVSEVLDLVREISDVEKINSVKSNKLLEQLGSQIQKINQGKKINNAYSSQNAAVTSSLFLDKKK
jgi:predicted nuclease with TOPRIM domain